MPSAIEGSAKVKRAEPLKNAVGLFLSEPSVAASPIKTIKIAETNESPSGREAMRKR
jgi:hypothetical protein